MPGEIPEATLDAVLTTQLVVAWAGEARCEPKRLGWWETDLVDEAGGADLLRLLAPTTWRWAAFEAAREAARRVDEQARKRMADPDAVRSIFFLGFAWENRLPTALRS
jgi:hypothetical protein